MKLTDEEIEKGLHDLTVMDLTDKTNYDSCGRLIPPRGMMIIQASLDYINRLKAERDKANDIANAEVKITDNIRNETEKAVVKSILDVFRGVDYYDVLFDGIQAIAEDEYGIRVTKDGDEIIFEVDDE